MTTREALFELPDIQLCKKIRELGNDYLFKFVNYEAWLNSEYNGKLDKTTFIFNGEPAFYKNDPTDETFNWLPCLIVKERAISGIDYVEIIDSTYPQIFTIPKTMLKPRVA